MYSGSLLDSLQLAISVNCLTLLVIITGVYFVYSYKTREKTFLAGALMTFNVMLFVLAETIIIITGWTGNMELGRHLHRAEQIAILMFLASLPYFLMNAFPTEGFLKKALDIFMWLGLALTVAMTAAAYIFPDSVISVTTGSNIPLLSPGDFTRGMEGPLFIVRDIGLSLFIVLALVYSIYYLIKKNRNFQSLALFIGVLIAILGGLDDMQYFYSGRNYFIENVRFSRFVFGSTVMMLFFLASVFSKYFKVLDLLENKTRELKASENKYSLVMDAADEIMFSLSNELEIVSANQKAEKIFHIGDEPLNFIDCLYLNEIDEEKDNQYFREQLLELQDDGDKLSFNTYIKDWVTFEPVEYHFRFDCFINGDKKELIARAWPTASSKLSEYIGTERISLDVDNYITMVGDIVDKLTANLRRRLEKGDVMMIKMGLNEMIVNAMEHGNLNVTFDEKTKAQAEGRLFDYMSERRQLPENRDKKVSIDYFFDEKKVIYRITDMGPGFDYEHIMNKVQNEVNQQELQHGRGIIMTQAVFDKVEYNKKGNQVLLMKEFPDKEQ
ncbi:MAG: ATP-binding protein [Spirochaetales bacterium]|uniref:ATP-binding protein n=1 Tax=Candidatus Thalassospirochaeta sargassi TaxID=3119039 RepID=A0AAJ1IGX5_9SPIO|nr:ATP-binding protein [Spirochaetales bacterium]